MTTRPVRLLLKGEVLDSRNVNRTNNLIMESDRTHNGGVGVGVLQGCEPRAHGTGSSHWAGCHILIQEEGEKCESFHYKKSIYPPTKVSENLCYWKVCDEFLIIYRERT